MLRIHTLLLPALAAFAIGGSAAAQTFETHAPSGAASLTPDAGVVVGSDSQGAWLWTQNGGFQSIGGETAVDLSDDASVVVGNRTGVTTFDGPAMWDATNGWVDLGGLPGQTPPGNSHGTAYSVSGDGAIVVGLGWHSDWKARGFRWDATNGMVELPQMGPGSSRASTISGDGAWIGGFDEHANGTRRAALWDASMNESLLLVRAENPDGYGEINDMSSDGSVIVGMDTLATLPASGYVWTATDGLVRFGPVPGTDDLHYNFANATSEDGTVVVGGDWDLLGNTTFATIWTPETGILFLSDYLTALGVQGLDQIQLANAIDVSADGTTILGWGVEFPFNFVWWEATIPSCDGGTASFCIASPNSVGNGALISSNGHVSMAMNDFQLSASPVPDQTGLFFFGPATAQLPIWDGTLCIGGVIQRLPVEMANGGTLSHAVDFLAPTAAALTPGSTWYFQAWYRDPAANGTGANLSNGLEVTFCN